MVVKTIEEVHIGGVVVQQVFVIEILFIQHLVIFLIDHQVGGCDAVVDVRLVEIVWLVAQAEALGDFLLDGVENIAAGAIEQFILEIVGNAVVKIGKTVDFLVEVVGVNDRRF